MRTVWAPIPRNIVNENTGGADSPPLSPCIGHAEGNRECGSVPPPILWLSNEEEWDRDLDFKFRFMVEGVETSILYPKGRQTIFRKEREC